jgi:hypothetical protein
MYQNEINELPRLNQDRYENIFNVYLNEDNKYYYNLLQNISFPTDLPEGMFTKYTVSPGDTLPYISYKLFGTINMWWVICLINQITNPTTKLEPGTILRVLNNDTLRVILQEINA